jgi:lipoprotein signal peptidase
MNHETHHQTGRMTHLLPETNRPGATRAPRTARSTRPATVVMAMAAAATLGITVLPAATSFAAAPPSTVTAAANLRITLDQLLGAHAILAQLAMEAGYSGAKDYPALVQELSQNTAALSAAIAGLYGKAAGAAFQRMWTGHIVDFVNYVVATKEHNATGQHAALTALAQYQTHFAAFLAAANPSLNRNALATDLGAHVAQLLATFNAYTKGEYALSARDFVTAYDHMFMTGNYLAWGIAKQFPAKFGHTSPETPAANLRAMLDMLLGAHAALAAWAMEAGYAGSPDFSAVAGVLNQNTQELGAVIASLYGAKAGAAFDRLWRGHIVDFVNYVVATKKGDQAGQAAALRALGQYKVQFADFMASADPHMNASVLAASLQVHVNQLVATFQADVRGQYGVSAADYVTAYNHMFMDGDYFAQAIVDQFPSKF